MGAEEQDELLRKIQAVYLGMTGFIDHMLGQVLEALDETGLADSTTVSFFSDHGDFAGDYGLVEKWSNAGEDIITRVPLIVRTPGRQGGPRGTRAGGALRSDGDDAGTGGRGGAAYAFCAQLCRPTGRRGGRSAAGGLHRRRV